KKRKKALDALPIAERQQHDRPGIRQSRLGDAEDDRTGVKRRKLGSVANSDNRADSELRRPRGDDVRTDSDADFGSDSEGNEWQMGDVDVDEDSDLDSDEAFGDSDEERFEDFTFRGSSKPYATSRSRLGAKPSSRAEEEFDLNEGEEEGNAHASTEDGSEDDLGEDAVDLATALDQWEESDGDQEEDEPNDKVKMRSIMSALNADTEESKKTAGLSNSVGLKHNRLSSTRKDGRNRALAPPLPKRQQDRVDRAAATKEVKKSLDKWIDTVKHNRRAEHLTFPLRDNRSADVLHRNRISSTMDSAPANELENAVHNILQESGLSSKSKGDQEGQIRAFEQLQANKMSLAEAQARQAELRKMRELLFREEVKAKRIKRIKSKAYRRVHRKERERNAQAEREALASTGADISDEERERHDRQRAEARMGAKLRNSKWAKDMRQSGRSAWDEEARESVMEMARRKDELMQRMQGETIREDGDGSDLSSDEDGDGSYEVQDPALQNQERRRLHGQLSRLSDQPAGDEPRSKLHSMAFMQKAESARNAQNQEDIERLKRDLDGEEESKDSEDDQGPVGRRTFSAPKKAVPESRQDEATLEFEEDPASDEERNAGRQSNTIETGLPPVQGSSNRRSARREKDKNAPVAHKRHEDTNADINPWLKQNGQQQKGTPESKGPDSKASQANVVESNRLRTVSKKQRSAGIIKPDEVTTSLEEQPGSGDESQGKLAPFVLRNQDLVQKAFAGDNVVADFEAEKREAVADEEEKVIDNTLPGWGSWVGEGISAKERKRAKGRFVQKEAGVKASDRQDAKLDRVIMNEKRVKKNTKYLSPGLPHPYESQAQYERAMRLPVGPEWTTKETFQNMTKPRVMVKQGVIAPMSRPMI
ncbi:small-subunit processome, partial [Viridothelium virens]